VLWIAGIQVAKPSKVKVGRFDITKGERTASGVMRLDVVRAGVRRVDVTWTKLRDDLYEEILDLLAANKPFFEFRYPDAGGTKSMVCYAGDINADIWHTINGVRYWDTVTIAFIEQ
jgi:hypothetical protein